jgi:N-methylhydantoinase A/oxoprolinase/acetone carboxylase beta subunit
MVTIDNGSTFTDGCLLADGALTAVKVLTTPYDLMRCFVDVFRALAREAGLSSEGELLRRVEEVRYSTTSGTNALLVRKGVRVGVIVGPNGAGDLYGLRQSNADLLEALVGDRVAAFDPKRTVGEEILKPIRELLAKGAQWIVVSLPGEGGAQAEKEFKHDHMKLLPAHLLGSVPVLYSRDLCGDADDARRTATAILNGFLHREIARFLYHAEGWVREHHVAQPLRIMRNDGACGRVAKTTAVKTLDSGPMGGLAGAAALALRAGEGKLITVDVGGTSSDVGMVDQGRAGVDLFGTVHGMPLSLSFPRLRTAGLGGGSVFRVEGKRITIGPDSAGALPGPSCFGRGGEDPTLTDAALIAGYLDAERFAAGAITLRPDLAEKSIVERIAARLGLGSAHAGARAMIDAFADELAAVVRSMVESCGWCAKDAGLAVFGGSGPLLSCLVAERLGIDRIIVPPASSSFSALGVGFADLAHEYRMMLDAPVAADAWTGAIRDLRDRAERDMFGEGVPSAKCRAEIRIRGENGAREFAVAEVASVPKEIAGAEGRVAIDYRFAFPGSGRGEFPRATANGAGKAASRRQRMALVGEALQSVSVVDGSTADELRGPCLVETPFWSAFMPAGWSLSRTEFGLRLTR